MLNNPSDLLAEGTTFVAADGVAARQLETHLAQRHLALGRSAWTGPSVLSYRAWTNTLWADQFRPDHRQLLSQGQVRGLWRQIIERSAISERLIGSRNVVDWVLGAAQRLRDWGVEVGELRAPPDDLDFGSFLDWSKGYERALSDAGWLDPGDAEVALRARVDTLPVDPDRVTIWADFDPMPAQVQLRQRLGHCQHRLETWTPAQINETCRRVRLPETAEELRAAGRWAAEKLAADPASRVAIVVPDLGARREAVHRSLDEVLSPERAGLGSDSAPGFFDLNGEPADRDPMIGSAVTALELLSPRGRFGTLSRWLRSPFFVTQPSDAAKRSRLEVDLRLTLDAQLGFLEAFRAGALASQVRAGAPALAVLLADAVRMVDAQPARATPTHWVDVWRRLLRHLGWQAEASSPQALRVWESALNELTLLTPVLGGISISEALRELQGVLAQPQRMGPTPLAGVFVLGRLEDVGPGYDGIWVSGLTDSRWPRPPQPNPILPLGLQRAHGMPLASPGAALEHARATTQRLIQRAPEVVLSWPSLLHEYPTQPSPLILQYPEVAESELTGGSDTQVAWRALVSKPRQTLPDTVPPLPDRRVHGGAYTLGLQATCPLRAFLESRLAARALEPVRRGVSARHRGIATHRAMELLLQALPTQRALELWEPSERRERVLSSVDKALREIFGRASGPLGVLFTLEAEGLREVLSAFLALDLGRDGFEVRSVEERLTVQLGGLELHCRIDRMDVLTPAGLRPALAIIDYKTGRGSTASDWLRDRPRDVQLPLYAVAVGQTVDAAVIALLRPDGVQYKGFWSRKGSFPGRSAPLPGGRTWAMQLDAWRSQLEGLAQEFAAGDARLFESELAPAKGPFAPLTRVFEQTALARGWLDRWGAE